LLLLLWYLTLYVWLCLTLSYIYLSPLYLSVFIEIVLVFISLNVGCSIDGDHGGTSQLMIISVVQNHRVLIHC